MRPGGHQPQGEAGLLRAMVKNRQLRLVGTAAVSKRNNPVAQGILGKGSRNWSVSGGHSLTASCGRGRWEV